jgi:hypothetical protein
MTRFRTMFCALLLAAGATAPARAADPCPRICLEGFVDRYIAAMVAHDPTRLPWASRALSTENGQAIAIGDGLWGTASKAGAYRLYVADPETGQVGFLGSIFEGGKPVLLALRLRIEDHVIAEAEMLVARPAPGTFFADAGPKLDAARVRPQFLRTVPEAERMSRDDLIRVANSYFTGLAANSGRNVAPFAPTCLRWENANQTTDAPRTPPPPGVDILAMGCEAQQKSGFFAFVTSIRNRRFPIVDRERGLVMAFGFFDHQGRIAEMTLTDGRKTPSPLRSPLTFQIAELFQIDRGKIDQIEAILDTMPYGMVSDVWDKRGE